MDKNRFNDLMDGLDESENNPQFSFDRNERILLIDGLNLFFRNFAMLNMVNPQGAHIGGLGGFIRSLGGLIRQMQPTQVYVVFDGEGSSQNRKNILPGYKSGRGITRITNWDVFENVEEEHDSKYGQIIRLIGYLKCLPIKMVAIDKVEADDIIAYLADYYEREHDSRVFIVSSDQDYIQLVTNNITLYRPIQKEYYTPKYIKENLDIPTENFILYKTLMGDSSDKVKGVKGLGKVKLYKLFPELKTQVMTLDNILEISAEKYKENIIYSRIVFAQDDLEKNYGIMDLSNPMLSKVEKQFLDEFAKGENFNYDPETFIKLYDEDTLGKIIRNIDTWLDDNFKHLK